MFRRVIVEDWSSLSAVIGFALAMLVFLIGLVQASKLRRSEADRLARMPLNDD